METVVAQIKIEEERKRTLTTEYEALESPSGPQAVDYATIARELRERTADVQAVLTRQTSQARQMLRKLLDGTIAVEPITIDGRRGFRLSGRLNVGSLLRAEVLRAVEAATRAEENNSPTVVAPTGFEPVNESGRVFAKALDQLRGANNPANPRNRNTLQTILRTELVVSRSAG